VRKLKSGKFFVFNTQHWSESDPLRHNKSCVISKILAFLFLPFLVRA
jgi:hypothetical protein